MTKIAKDAKPFEYKEAKIPFYAPKAGAKGAVDADAVAARSR